MSVTSEKWIAAESLTEEQAGPNEFKQQNFYRVFKCRLKSDPEVLFNGFVNIKTKTVNTSEHQDRNQPKGITEVEVLFY